MAQCVSTRDDLEALAAPERAVALAALAGSLHRIRRDERGRPIGVDEDLSLIERFGFTRADFQDVRPPLLPAAAPLDQLRAERLAELAAIRYQAETRGIAVDGLPVQTDRETRPNLIAAYAAAAGGLRAEGCVWKFADGVARAVSAETLMAMATAVLDHVQRCYDHEAVVAEIIRASDDPLALDLHTGWPGQSAPVPAQP
jgi:hypothetical protein